MIIIRTSIVSGITRKQEMNITPEQLYRHEKGELIQNVMPHLTEGEREFFLTGITPEEWDELMPEED